MPQDSCPCWWHLPWHWCPACLHTGLDGSRVRPGSEKKIFRSNLYFDPRGKKERDSWLGCSSSGEGQVRWLAAGARLSPFPAVPLTLGTFHSPSSVCNTQWLTCLIFPPALGSRWVPLPPIVRTQDLEGRWCMSVYGRESVPTSFLDLPTQSAGPSFSLWIDVNHLM